MRSFGKFLICLLVMTLPGSVSALVLSGTEVISDTGIDFWGYDGYNYVSEITFGAGITVPIEDIAEWGHTLDTYYMTVPDHWRVVRAVLQIEGSTPYGVGDQIVVVQEGFRWTQPTGWECLTSYSDQVFEMSDLDPSVWNATPLMVSLDHPAAVPMTIYTAKLLVEYGPGTAVPEPATIFLFGAGLVGGGALIRRRKRK